MNENNIKFAKQLRSEGLSYAAIAKQMGFCRNTVTGWICPEQREKAKTWRSVYYLKNKEKIAKNKKKWHQENRERILLLQKQYRENSKGKLAKYRRVRYHNDEQFRLATVLRSRLSHLSKAGSAVSDLGCSTEFLRSHLESQFTEGMTWENYGRWHIDHIKPLSKFDLTDREQFLKACHYTNLQPLWAEDNLLKSDNYEADSRSLEPIL